MREAIADYQVVSPWEGPGTRYTCRPPDRLGLAGDVMVRELGIDAEGWQQLCDSLVRLAPAGPGLVEVYELGPDLETGGVFVVTEAADRTLAGAGGSDRPARVAAVAAVARAAHDLHEAGLAHGAIQADTVLLTGRGPVLDLPRLDAPAGEVTRVGPWSELVTVDPELLAGESPGRSSDIWALGATLHVLLSDRPLYPGIEGDEPVTAVQRVMFTRPEPDPELPADLRELIGACLAADPADRPPSALAVAERLAEAGLGR